MEDYIAGHYNELTTLNQQYGALKRTNDELTERMQVLNRCAQWGSDAGAQAATALGGGANDRPLLGEDPSSVLGWQYLCGVVPAEEKIRFERMIFRATR